MQGKMQVLSKITDIIMQSMEIIGIDHKGEYHIMVDKFDPDCKDSIQRLCDENGLEWKVAPYPYLHTRGFSMLKRKSLLMERIGAKIMLTDPSQEDNEFIPSMKDYVITRGQ